MSLKNIFEAEKAHLPYTADRNRVWADHLDDRAGPCLTELLAEINKDTDIMASLKLVTENGRILMPHGDNGTGAVFAFELHLTNKADTAPLGSAVLLLSCNFPEQVYVYKEHKIAVPYRCKSYGEELRGRIDTAEGRRSIITALIKQAARNSAQQTQETALMRSYVKKLSRP